MSKYPQKPDWWERDARKVANEFLHTYIEGNELQKRAR